MAASRSRTSWLRRSNRALWDSASTRVWPRWTKPMLTRSQRKRMASSVATAVAAAAKRSWARQVPISSIAVTRRSCVTPPVSSTDSQLAPRRSCSTTVRDSGGPPGPISTATAPMIPVTGANGTAICRCSAATPAREPERPLMTTRFSAAAVCAAVNSSRVPAVPAGQPAAWVARPWRAVPSTTTARAAPGIISHWRASQVFAADSITIGSLGSLARVSRRETRTAHDPPGSYSGPRALAFRRCDPRGSTRDPTSLQTAGIGRSPAQTPFKALQRDSDRPMWWQCLSGHPRQAPKRGGCSSASLENSICCSSR